MWSFLSRKQEKVENESKEIKVSDKNNLQKLPDEMIISILTLLDEDSLKVFSRVSKTFPGKLMTDMNALCYWEKNLLALGCDEKALNTVIKSKKIADYQRLCRSIARAEAKDRKKLLLWELFCLSGDVTVIAYALQDFEEVPEGLYGCNALHYAALSGSAEAMGYCVNNLNVPPESKNNLNMNALHFSVLSGSIDALCYAIQELKINRHSRSSGEKSAIHFAAGADSVMMLKYLNQVLKMDLSIYDDDHNNFLDYAAESGSLETTKFAVLSWYKTLGELAPNYILYCLARSDSTIKMRYVLKELSIDGQTEDRQGMNALHHAALRGSINTMHYAATALKIDVHSTDKNGRNALHCAALSGSVKAVDYAATILKINIHSVDRHGDTLLHFAVSSASVEVVEYVLDVLQFDLYSVGRHGENALHVAAHQGAVDVVRYLLALGMIRGKRDKLGNTALQLATESVVPVFDEEFTLVDRPMLSIKKNHYFFSSESKKETKHQSSWKSSLMSLGCQIEAVMMILQSGMIKSEEALYKTISLISYKKRKLLSASDLFCLSGDVTAVAYAVDVFHLYPENIGNSGLNLLHMAALSGSVKAIEYAVKVLKIPTTSESRRGANVLHFAARSGSLEAIDYVLYELNIYSASIDNKGKTALHAAVIGGSEDAVRYFRQLGFSPDLSSNLLTSFQYAETPEMKAVLSEELIPLAVSPRALPTFFQATFSPEQRDAKLVSFAKSCIFDSGTKIKVEDDNIVFDPVKFTESLRINLDYFARFLRDRGFSSAKVSLDFDKLVISGVVMKDFLKLLREDLSLTRQVEVPVKEARCVVM